MTQKRDPESEPRPCGDFKGATTEQAVFELAMRMPVALSIWQGDGIGPGAYRLIAVNKAFEGLTGWKSADIIGKTASVVFPEIVTAERAELYQRVVETGEPVHLDFRPRQYGRPGAVFSEWAFRLGEQCLGIVIEDITESVDATESLRSTLKQSESYFQSIMENTSDVVGIIGDTGLIEFINPCVERLTGFKPEEVVSNSFIDYVHPDDIETAARKLADLEDTPVGTVRATVLRFKTKAGGWRIGESVGKVVPDGQGSFKVVAVIRDITDRVKAERDLEMANAELEGYSRTVSHDLKAPLSSISLAASTLPPLLGKLDDEGTAGQVVELVDVISRNVQKSKQLIDDLLELAGAGQRPRDVGLVDVSDVVARILDERRQLLEEKGVKVVTDDDLGLVIADETHVYQVFSNLLANAVAHNTNPEPRVSITYLGVDGDGHRYSVRDNGEGIAPWDLDKVFMPFFKGDGGETGIGLSIVDKIVKTYQGSIVAFNDGGACFEFVIGPPPV